MLETIKNAIRHFASQLPDLVNAAMRISLIRPTLRQPTVGDGAQWQ